MAAVAKLHGAEVSLADAKPGLAAKILFADTGNIAAGNIGAGNIGDR